MMNHLAVVCVVAAAATAAFVFSALPSVSRDPRSKISMLRVTLRLLGNRRNGHEHLFFKFQDATTLNLVRKRREAAMTLVEEVTRSPRPLAGNPSSGRLRVLPQICCCWIAGGRPGRSPGIRAMEVSVCCIKFVVAGSFFLPRVAPAHYEGVDEIPLRCTLRRRCCRNKSPRKPIADDAGVSRRRLGVPLQRPGGGHGQQPQGD